jgi:hypothetical protein
MTRLRDVAKLIRSKNAGPFELTFDIVFGDPESYEQVRDSGTLNPAGFSRLYGVPEDQVRVFNFDAGRAIKVTIPRPTVSGSLGDSDVYGAQQFGPLADLEVVVGS